MRVKETRLCCAFAWSPLAENPGLIATGSIAGAMDDDFCSDAHLEIRKCDLWNSLEPEMPVIARVPMYDRVHRVDWTSYGGELGLIAGGLVDGTVCVWSAKSVMDQGISNATSDHSVLCRLQAHSGAVRGCHFNLVQPHFLATGGQDREFKVYSMMDTSKVQEVPSCGKSTATGEITDIRWNSKFGHILATTTSTGQVTVWDLKARRSALSFFVAHSNSPPATTLAWHPETATHVAVARDDPYPSVQIWDLKKAVSPLYELNGHSKGILGLAWSADDPSILVSCGRDGRTIFWNPLTGTITGGLPEEDNYVNEVRWSPHIPAVIATGSFSSSGLSVFSVQDMGSSGKWLSRPAAASFGFGSRIAMTSNDSVKIVDAPRPRSATSASEKEFREVLSTNPLNTDGAVEWMKSKDWGIVAAAAAARNTQTKMPLLEYLNADPSASETSLGELKEGAKDDKVFSQGVSKLIVCGKLSAAVDVCLDANRFDDAFAVACLEGTEALQKVQKAYFDWKLKRHRFVRYLSAISSGQFEDLASDEDAPWEECLALLAAYAPSAAFSTACNALGYALSERGNCEGAATCFVCAANIDQAVAMWKKIGKYDNPSLVHAVSVLEQISEQACTSPVFALSLAAHARMLADEGEFANAAYYAQRASQMGNPEAGEVADRLKFIAQGFTGQVAFPFALDEIPDATSIECQMLQGQNVQQNAAQGADIFGGPPPTETRGARHANAAASHMHPQPQQTVQPLGYSQPQTQPQFELAEQLPTQQLHHSSQQYGQPHSQPHPHSQPQPWPQPQPHGQPQPLPQPQLQPHSHSPPQPWPQPQPQPQPVGPQPNYFQTPEPPLPQQMQRKAEPAPIGPIGNLRGSPVSSQMPQPPIMPNPLRAPPPVPFGGAMATQGHAAPPPMPPVAGEHQRSNVGQVPQPPPLMQPSSMASHADPHQPQPPDFTQNTGATPHPLPPRPNVIAPRTTIPTPKTQSAGTRAAGTAEDVPFNRVDVSAIPPQYHPIVTIVTDRINKISDRRKRDAVEKAASVLFRSLNEGTIPEPVAMALLEWSATIGTPSGKEMWRQISDKYWNTIQAFVNIKFL